MTGPKRTKRALRAPELARMLALGDVISVTQFVSALDDDAVVHYQTAVRWCRDGWLPASRLGREWMIRPAGLHGWRLPKQGNPNFSKEG